MCCAVTVIVARPSPTAAMRGSKLQVATGHPDGLAPSAVAMLGAEDEYVSGALVATLPLQLITHTDVLLCRRESGTKRGA